MKKFALCLAAAFTFAIPTAFACEGHEQKAEIQKVTVQQLASLQKENKAKVFDVNGSETRAKMGVIPGAVLLTSAAKFDPAKELPATKDSKLVFYCASTMCNASHMAAERALEAGYTDVAVLPDGIAGWKQAGQKTAQPNS